jgi:integrase
MSWSRTASASPQPARYMSRWAVGVLQPGPVDLFQPRQLDAIAQRSGTPGARRVPGRVHRPDREAYALDLRQFAGWCARHSLRLFDVRRADIECFGRDLEARGRARAIVTRRLCTVAGFYRYAVEKDLPGHSPAAHVRRPRLDYESHATGLDRNEIGALLVAAGLGPASEHALISLLALNGLRVSEATGADIEAPSIERGHRTLAIVRKGGQKVTIPLAPRTARAIDLAIGERGEGPIFLSPGGARLDRHGAGRSEAARAVLCCAASMVNPVRRRWGARRLRAPRFRRQGLPPAVRPDDGRGSLLICTRAPSR